MLLKGWITAIALPWLICMNSHLMAQGKDTTDSNIQKKLDPTDFRSRLEFRNETQRTQVDGSRMLLIPRLDYAVSKELAVRLEVPFVSETSNGAGGRSGIGDILVRGAYRAYRGEGMAWVVGGEVTLDTGQDGVGSGTNILTGFTFVSLDQPQWKSVLFPYFQYSTNVGGGPQISQSLWRVSALTRWPERFYSFVESTMYVDHEHGARVAGTLEIEVGRFVSSDVALWIRPGVGIHRHALPQIYDWNLEVGFRYFIN